MTIINPTHSQPPQASLIPERGQIEQQFGGDAAAQLAAMLFLFARERSRDASEQRDVVEQRIAAQEARQVDQMREAAHDLRRSGAVEGAAKIASGAATLLSVTSEGPTSDDPKYYQALAAGFEGVGAMGGGYFQGSSKLHDASAERASNAANAGVRELEEVNQDADEARDMRGRVLDFLDAVQEGRADAESSMWVRG